MCRQHEIRQFVIFIPKEIVIIMVVDKGSDMKLTISPLVVSLYILLIGSACAHTCRLPAQHMAANKNRHDLYNERYLSICE